MSARQFGKLIINQEELADHENEGRTIFVAIGLGGAIAKRILLDARESVTHWIWEKCDGIINIHPTASSYRLRSGIRLPYDRNLMNEAQVINNEFQTISSMVNTADIRNTPRRLFQSPAESSQEHEGSFETNTYEAYSQSNDWYRVLDESDDLFMFILDKVVTWLRRGQNISANTQLNTRADPHLRILSIDGGGVRGLCSLLVLKRLMTAIRDLEVSKRPETKDEAREPVNYFQFAGGTSTGGLICIMLFRLEMKVSDAIEEYRRLSPIIFRQRWTRFLGSNMLKAAIGRPWFDGKALEKGIRDLLIRNLPAAERSRLQDEMPDEVQLHSGNNQRVKMFVCAVRKDNAAVTRFKNYGQPNACKVWEAATATCAAPFYFPTARVNGIGYWDGGLGANNPISQVWLEKKLLFPKPDTKCVISLGTGRPEKVTKSWIPLIGRAKRVLGHLMNTEVKHKKFEDKAHKHDIFYRRFNPTTSDRDIGMADHRLLDLLESYTDAYLDADDIRDDIWDCARLLARWQDE
ncbi:FabD/lysophospholipase-like protein [Aspergillus uvarum CBS 121591]|uniref:FabD/lysophospholipase-like protein n=1 Tax=Aspergillus uvarum CBS 121591 TaxID=1448315 RepID=A0A319C929_9EURO|nr:FabD/lysophospholipase-like protein [Aspergillus uvarum CBS 121591]PYH80217.1 FabD/lysophospholipase-like protein [Aspergillus uvarum CBS 121591]